ncbi:baseplate wedge subunit [Escherichia phage FP43]|uniref:Baseplate wedge subunit n=1 Tax=Escherichia phage FP43 TaxID=2666261 RepID=A0A650EZM8_9CAUD|nr:baseplate wedge subunit [Escherichia phage FP43]
MNVLNWVVNGPRLFVLCLLLKVEAMLMGLSKPVMDTFGNIFMRFLPMCQLTVALMNIL